MFDYKEYKEGGAFTVCVNTKCKKRNNCWMYANKKDLDNLAEFRKDMGVSIKIYKCN
jgi:hypothetical protein